MAVLALVLASPVRAQSIIYVDADATGANDGSSWSDAYTNLQSALTPSKPIPKCPQALGGTGEVWVAEGVYRPTPPGAGDDRNDAFGLRNGLQIYGGFAGGETQRDQRDPAAHPTVLSGDIGVPGDSSDNSFHVVVADGTDATAVLDGFQIEGGTALAATASKLTGEVHGGGLFIARASPTVRDCLFVSNRAYLGGGVAVQEGAPTFERCRFERNTAAIGGGGMYLENASPTCRGCRFERNEADVAGGGLLTALESNPVFVDTLFLGNQAQSGGGAQVDNRKPLFVNCRFLGNRAERVPGEPVPSAGGGLNSHGSPTLFNSVFSGNTADFGGGMASVVKFQEGPLVAFSVFASNTATREGGGLFSFQQTQVGTSLSPPRLAGSILWRNRDGGGTGERAQITVSSGSIEIVDSDVQGWTGRLGGAGNFNLNPRFADFRGPDNAVGSEDDDLRLSVGSPCIDAADLAPLPIDSADLDRDGDTGETLPLDVDGAPRTGSSAVPDQGPYEAPDADTRQVKRGETVVLNPGAGGGDPTRESLVQLTNVSGPSPALVTVKELRGPQHSGDPVFVAIGRTLQITTTLADGQFLMTVQIPFETGELGGLSATAIDLRTFDVAAGAWRLAVAGNRGASPGHAGPVGDRFAVVGSSVPPLSAELGDYGVFWNPAAGRGFVWANVDHASDFAPTGEVGVTVFDCDRNGLTDLDDIAAGRSLDCDGSSVPDACEVAAHRVPDCNGNGVPDACDVIGGADGDCDFNGRPDRCDLAQGGVDLDGNHLLDVCERVGTCGDVDRNGVIDLQDYAAFYAAFQGPDQPPAAGGAAQDLDADGDVDLQDFMLFAERVNARLGFPPDCLPNGPVLRATRRCLPPGAAAAIEVDVPPIVGGTLKLSLLPESSRSGEEPAPLDQRSAPLDGSTAYRFTLSLPATSGLYLAVAQLLAVDGSELGRDAFTLGVRPEMAGVPESICTFDVVHLDPIALRRSVEDAVAGKSALTLPVGAGRRVEGLEPVPVPLARGQKAGLDGGAAPALYRGHLAGAPASEVRLTFANGRFYSLALLADEDEEGPEAIYTEPLGIYQAGAPADLHVVYSSHAVSMPPVLDSGSTGLSGADARDAPADKLAAATCPPATIDVNLFYDHEDPDGLRFRDFNHIAGIYQRTLGVTLRLRRERRLSSDAYREPQCEDTVLDFLEDFECDRFAQLDDSDVALMFTFNPRRFSYENFDLFGCAFRNGLALKTPFAWVLQPTRDLLMPHTEPRTGLPSLPTLYSAHQVALTGAHEIGHLLGLEHRDQPLVEHCHLRVKIPLDGSFCGLPKHRHYSIMKTTAFGALHWTDYFWAPRIAGGRLLGGVTVEAEWLPDQRGLLIDKVQQLCGDLQP